MLIEEDPTASLMYLSTTLNLRESTVQRILTVDLKKKSVCARWITYVLTEVHKQQRVRGAENILNSINGNVIMIDENWLYAKHFSA